VNNLLNVGLISFDATCEAIGAFGQINLSYDSENCSRNLTVTEESFYHRRKLPSQTPEVAKMQIASQVN
jgi:hypothetical protein